MEPGRLRSLKVMAPTDLHDLEGLERILDLSIDQIGSSRRHVGLGLRLTTVPYGKRCRAVVRFAPHDCARVVRAEFTANSETTTRTALEASGHMIRGREPKSASRALWFSSVAPATAGFLDIGACDTRSVTVRAASEAFLLVSKPCPAITARPSMISAAAKSMTIRPRGPRSSPRNSDCGPWNP